MARWRDIVAEAPDLTERARTMLDANVHKTMATLRKDGSPRISGTECMFVDDDLWFGSMWQATKARDLLRDPRFAMHSASMVEPEWAGDAKLAGRAESIEDAEVIKHVVGGEPPEQMHLFRADIDELVVISLNAKHTALIIESWHPERGLTRTER